MKKLLLLLSALSFLGWAQPTLAADETDIAKISCKDFLGSGDKNIGILLTWIDGYMSAKSDNTIMSEAWMEKLGTHMGSYCAKNPTHTIMQAIDSVPSE